MFFNTNKKTNLAESLQPRRRKIEGKLCRTKVYLSESPVVGYRQPKLDNGYEPDLHKSLVKLTAIQNGDNVATNVPPNPR